MPNLAGVFDMRSSPTDIAAMVSTMARVLDVPGVDYTVRSWCDTRFGAVNLLNGISGNLDQPSKSENGIVLFLDGEVSNLAEIQDTSKALGEGISEPTSACLALYLRDGDDFVKQLNGQFNILVYDAPNRTVKVFNDRLAYRPLFFWFAGGLALFGLEKKALFASLQETPTFDPMGVLEFMTFGHNLADRTIFSGVQVMPQGAVLEFTDNELHMRQYWRPAFDGKNKRISVEEAARELGRRLCIAVKRRTVRNRKYGIFLSGGLDSRAAAGALARFRPGVTSFNFGSDDSPDLQYGRELTLALGFDYYRLCGEKVSLTEVLPRVVWRTEGSIPFNQTLSVGLHREIRAKAHVIFNGLMGDVVTGATTKRPEQFLGRNARQLTAHLLRKRTLLQPSVLQTILRPAFLEGAYPEMVRQFEASLLALEEERLPLLRILWDMTVRQRRSAFSSPAADRYVIEPVTPFTDNDLLDWMLGMSLRHLFGQRVYKRMIVETFPEISHVRWATTRRRISTNVLVDSAVLGWLFAVRRIHRVFAKTRPAADEEHLGDLRTFVDTRFAWDLFPDDLFDRDGIRSVTKAALDGSGPATPLFLVLTLAECARLFVNGKLTEPPPETWPVL